MKFLLFANPVAFAPAIIPLAIVAPITGGQDGDLIIAVDGSRVTNVIDLEDCLRDTQPGEIVYFTIVRSSTWRQVSILIPPTAQ